jgi:hypothetical protein
MLTGIRGIGAARSLPATYAEPMTERIVLEPEEIAGLIRGSRLLELRADTPDELRSRLLSTAATAMDALCGLCERAGTDAVWDVLELLEHRELLAFSTLMASELSQTGFPAGD